MDLMYESELCKYVNISVHEKYARCRSLTSVYTLQNEVIRSEYFISTATMSEHAEVRKMRNFIRLATMKMNNLY